MHFAILMDIFYYSDLMIYSIESSWKHSTEKAKILKLVADQIPRIFYTEFKYQYCMQW